MSSVLKSSPPQAPDYAAAAQAQGGANIEAAIAQGVLNRPNQNTPLGSQTWNQTGSYRVGNYDVPIFTNDVQLTPQGQRIQSTDLQTQEMMGQLGLQGVQKASGILGQEFDVNKIPGMENTMVDRNAVRDALVARQENQLAIDEDNKRSDLIARGIPEGSKAFNAEMDRLDRARTDARQQAEIGADAALTNALAGRRQLISEALLNRQTPLNEIASLRSGSQIQLPNFQVGSAGNVAAAPIMGATQAQFDAAVDAANLKNVQRGQNLKLAGDLAQAFGGAMAFSDRRLKSNVRRIGTHALGIGIYEYDIFGRREVGVMADEVFHVKPEAVGERDGYMTVNYGML